MVNLLLNAHRYGNEGILVAAHQSQSATTIEIHDDGPGVPVKYRNVIWERFERGARRLDAATPGPGLGLPIVASLVRAHGGTVKYQPSKPLGGACFTITLPTHTPDRLDADATDAKPNQQTKKHGPLPALSGRDGRLEGPSRSSRVLG